MTTTALVAKAKEPEAVAAVPLNVYQRVVAVTKAVTVAASGKNAHGTKAMSIVDVENAISDAMAEHGLVTRWETRGLSAIDQRTWQADVRVMVVNAEDPQDCFADDWADTGGSPAAAYSFARKSYYKALFHLTEDEDEAKQTPTGNTPPPVKPANGNGGEKPTREPVGRACPSCGEGDLQKVTWPDGNSRIQCTEWKTCKYREAVVDQTPTPFG